MLSPLFLTHYTLIIHFPSSAFFFSISLVLTRSIFSLYLLLTPNNNYDYSIMHLVDAPDSDCLLLYPLRIRHANTCMFSVIPT